MAPRTLTVRPPSSPNRRSAGLFAKAVKNNTPSSFNDRTLRDYLKNFSRQRGTDGQGDTFSTEVDTLSLGSTLQILPRVLSGERLGLLLTMSQASLVELQTLPLGRSEEHTSELQSLMRISYAVFCLKKKKINTHNKI